MDSLISLILLAAVVSAAAAVLVTSLVAGSRIRRLRSELSDCKAELKAQEKLLDERQKVYQKTVSDLKSSSDEALKAQVEALKSEVTATTEKVLKMRQSELSQSNMDELGQILSPLKESIETMKKAMTDNEAKNVETATSLKVTLEEAVKAMGEKTAEVGAKADSLSEALTSRPKMQGCWGETFLDDILSKEGLEEGLHYDREVASEDRSRPDFVFHFMEGLQKKDLVVDSKVSLTAFVDYVNAQDDQARADALARHIRSVRKHIDELSAKDYAGKIDKSRRFADYVLMFMPIDAAYRLAMDADYSIWQYGYSRGVLIATEQTIMPFLKVIRLTWNKYRQDESMAEMMGAAEAVIDRVRLFYDSYRNLGKHLKSVVDDYNAGAGKLKDDGRSITTSARKLMRLGARSQKAADLAVPDEQVFFVEESED